MNMDFEKADKIEEISRGLNRLSLIAWAIYNTYIDRPTLDAKQNNTVVTESFVYLMETIEQYAEQLDKTIK